MSTGLSLVFGQGPQDISLTDVAPEQGFQRTEGANSGPARVQYSYIGAPPAAEGQVVLATDNSVIVPWTALTSRSESAGSGSGIIPGLPCISGGQCGPYKLQVRRGDNHGFVSRGSNQCWVGACFLLYGQSNMGVMTHTTNGSPPSPASATRYYGASPVDIILGWQSVPPGNGIIQLLNGLKILLGVPTFAVNAAIPATDASFLVNTNWPNIIALLQAMTGGDVEGAFWDQGENNTIASSANLPGQTQFEYLTIMDTFRTRLLALTGRVSMPIITASLSTQKPPDVPPAHGSDFWPQQQRNLVKTGLLTEFKYSHSRTFAAIGVDGLHINGDDCDKRGKMFAHDMAVAKGVGSGMSDWRIIGGAIVSATTTTVSLQHSLGTDFTPTTGIVGFELSFDGGATWVVPTAAVRVDSVTILLTHSSANLKSRLVRYLWSWTPWSAVGVYAANVYDNSANVCPLGFTEDWIVCSGAFPTPVPTLCLPQPRFTFDNGTLKAGMQSHVGIGGASANRLLIVGVGQQGTLPTSVTVTPYAGNEVSPGSALTPVSLTKVAGTTGGCTIWKGIVPSGQSCLIEAVYPSNPFSGIGFCVWRVDSSLMSSTTPVDAQRVAFLAGAASATLNIATSADGFVTVIADQADTYAVISGTEAYCQDFLMPVSAFCAAHSAVNAANAASAVTDTMPTGAGTTNNTLVAASWR